MRTGTEECDCGAADCSLADPCCDGSTCMYAAGAVCSPAHEECCVGSCVLAGPDDGKECRGAPGLGKDSACDAVEYCDGTSRECPADRYA